MTVQVKELLSGVRIVDRNGEPTAELIEIIQRLVNASRNHEARITTLEP